MTRDPVHLQPHLHLDGRIHPRAVVIVTTLGLIHLAALAWAMTLLQ